MKTDKPRIVMFQCQFCLAAEDDQHWVENNLPAHVKLIKTSCTGRISPLYILNALQGGADGVLVCGCMPEKCHYKEGNLGARRQLDEFRALLEYTSLEEERVRFKWMNINERGEIQRVIEQFTRDVAALPRPQALDARAQAKGEYAW